MKRYYDKILHVSVSFFLLTWLTLAFRLLSISDAPFIAFIIVVVLCFGKVIWNYHRDSEYNPMGDWCANIVGFIIWGIYEGIIGR